MKIRSGGKVYYKDLTIVAFFIVVIMLSIRYWLL